MPIVALTGSLQAAPQVCFPRSLPAWLSDCSPRCGTEEATSVELSAVQQEELADLVALAWWECEQASGDAEPFAGAFAAACAAYSGTNSAARR